MSIAVRLRDHFWVAVVLLSVGSCKDDNSLAEDNMPTPTKARPEGFADIDTGARPNVPAKRKKSTTDAGVPKSQARPALSVTEITALGDSLPKLEGELVVKALAVVSKSRVATLTVCLSKPLTKATSQVVRAYRDNGWEDIRVTTPPIDKERKRLSANSVRYRMTATVEGGATIGCPTPEPHSKVAMRFQERTPPPTVQHKTKMMVPKKKALHRPDPASVRRAPNDESRPPAPQDSGGT
ncbi:MAG: hypothetical protein GY811_19095 [Myxococcales bacterium]|nr:hypothetical protein [Myxococcales bacterium]